MIAKRIAEIEGQLVEFEVAIHPLQLPLMGRLVKNRPYLGIGKIHSINGYPTYECLDTLTFYGPDRTCTEEESLKRVYQAVAEM